MNRHHPQLHPAELGLPEALWEVSYSIRHVHDVTVGIRAHTGSEAIRRAKAAFDAGTLWDDTPDMPLLQDDFEEEDDGRVLTFEAERVDAWCAPSSAVSAFRKQSCAEGLLRRFHQAVDALLVETSKDIYTDAPECRPALEALAVTLAELHVLAEDTKSLLPAYPAET